MERHASQQFGSAGFIRRALRAPRAFLSTLLICAAVLASAHPASIASARAKVQLDGSFELKIRFDALAYCLDLPPSDVADGPMNALLDGPDSALQASLDDASARFNSELKAFGDGKPFDLSRVALPSASEVEAIAKQSSPRLPVIVTVVLKGHLPAGAKASSFSFPQGLGTVVLTTEFPYQEPLSEPVEPANRSADLAIPTAAAVQTVKREVAAHAAVSEPSFEGAKASAVVLADMKAAPTPPPVKVLTQPVPEAPAPPARAVKTVAPPQSEPVSTSLRADGPSWYESFPRYVRMGFDHILPQGLDHILFVLGLFLLSTRTKDLLKQITAFTLAHSLTLALSLYGVVQLPRSIVEPVIALSIVFVAVENLCTTKMHRWRVGIVFLFGLVHGLGFASALRDAGLARADFLTALVGFNAGVEIGQLAVVAAALLLVGWFRQNARYRSLVALPASAIIAATALVWTFERLL